MSKDRLNLAYQVRKARSEARLTQEELGAMIGTYNVQVSRFENGRRKLEIKWLQRIADATNHELVIGLIPRNPPHP